MLIDLNNQEIRRELDTIFRSEATVQISRNAAGIFVMVALTVTLSIQAIRDKLALEKTVATLNTPVMTNTLRESWNQKHTIYARYTVAGVPQGRIESLAGFGCILPQFAILVPDMAKQVLKERLISTYNHGLWSGKDDYYGQNWAWFGIALTFNKLAIPQVS